MAITDSDYQQLLGRIGHLQTIINQAKAEYNNLVDSIAGKVDTLTLERLLLLYDSMFVYMQKQISLIESEVIANLTDIDHDITSRDIVNLRSGTIERDGDGVITAIQKTGGRTISITRSGGQISTVTDGEYTWTFGRDVDGNIIAWNVE